MTQVVSYSRFKAADIAHPTGLVHGAQILTLRGRIPVQDLNVGDHLLTPNQGAVSVRRIDQKSLITRAVYFIAGTIGHGKRSDSLLCAGQTVFLDAQSAGILGHRSHVLMRAADLVDGEFIRDLGQCPLTLYQIYCETAQIIHADSMLLGTADLINPTSRHPAA